jgi:hypothetical protein
MSSWGGIRWPRSPSRLHRSCSRAAIGCCCGRSGGFGIRGGRAGGRRGVGCRHGRPCLAGCPSLCDHVVAALARAAWLAGGGRSAASRCLGAQGSGVAQLFTSRERPSPVALLAGNGGAALIGVVLPGRFDDAMRIAVVRRYPGLSCRFAGDRSFACHARSDRQRCAGAACRRGRRIPRSRDRCACRARAGCRRRVAAAIVALPHFAASNRSLRFRLGRWLSPRTTSLRRTAQAWAFVFGCWLVRGVAFFILLGTFGLGYSLPLALLFLCRRCCSCGAPDRPSGRSYPGRRGNSRSRRYGRRNIASARCRCLRWRPRSLLRGSLPALRHPWRTGGRLLPARTTT